jgi:ribonuclease-3
MSEFLLEKYSSESEGMISRRHSGLVCGSVLSEVAKRIGLPQILQMSQGERNLGGAHNNHNLENCLEALIAAIYRDGGLAAAKNFVIDSWQSFLQEKDEFRKDPVSCLQEIMQEACKRVPEYLVSREKGLDHAPVFVAKLVFANGIWGKIEETAKKDLQSLRHFTSNFLPNKSFMALCKSTGCIEFLSKGNSKKEAIRNVAVKTLSFFSLN